MAPLVYFGQQFVIVADVSFVGRNFVAETWYDVMLLVVRFSYLV